MASDHRHRSLEPPKPAAPEWRKLERENERLNRELERLRQELIDKERRLKKAEERIADAEKQIADAEKQIADPERKLALQRQNSTTSSKPPSSDGLAGEQRARGRKTKKSQRKPSGQPGHNGHWRGLVPASRVTQVIEVFPVRCRHCEDGFGENGRKSCIEGEPRRHQITELPRIQAQITEYRCQRVVCRQCGKTTQAELPPDLTESEREELEEELQEHEAQPHAFGRVGRIPGVDG